MDVIYTFSLEVWKIVVVSSVEVVLGVVIWPELSAALEYLASNSRTSWPRMRMTTRSMRTPMIMTAHRNTGKHRGSESSRGFRWSARCSDGRMDFWSRLKFTFFFG